MYASASCLWNLRRSMVGKSGDERWPQLQSSLHCHRRSGGSGLCPSCIRRSTCGWFVKSEGRPALSIETSSFDRRRCTMARHRLHKRSEWRLALHTPRLIGSVRRGPRTSIRQRFASASYAASERLSQGSYWLSRGRNWLWMPGHRTAVERVAAGVSASLRNHMAFESQPCRMSADAPSDRCSASAMVLQGSARTAAGSVSKQFTSSFVSRVRPPMCCPVLGSPPCALLGALLATPGKLERSHDCTFGRRAMCVAWCDGFCCAASALGAACLVARDGSGAAWKPLRLV